MGAGVAFASGARASLISGGNMLTATTPGGLVALGTLDSEAHSVE